MTAYNDHSKANLAELTEKLKKNLAIEQTKRKLMEKIFADPEYIEAKREYEMTCSILEQMRKEAEEKRMDVFKKVMDKVSKEMNFEMNFEMSPWDKELI